MGEKHDLVLAFNLVSNSCLSLTNDLNQQLSKLDAALDNSLVRLKYEPAFALDPLVNPLLEELLESWHKVTILHWFTDLQVVLFELLIDLELAQEVQTVIVEQRVVDRLEAKAFNDLLLKLLAQVICGYSNIVKREHVLDTEWQ